MAALSSRLELVQRQTSPPVFTTFTFSTNTQQVAGLWTPTVSDNITAIVFRVNSGGSATETYRVGLQTLNASGDPSGTWINSNTAFADVSPVNGVGSYTGTFASPAPVVAGTDYAVVITNPSGTGPTAVIAYGVGSMTQRRSYVDAFNGTTWTKGGTRPNFLLIGQNGTYGDYIPTQTSLSMATGTEIAQLIQIPAGLAQSVSLNGIEVCEGSGGTAGTYDVLIYPGNQLTDTASVTGVSGAVNTNKNTASNLYSTYVFPSPVTLTPGNWYRISVKNNSGVAGTLTRITYASTAEMNGLVLGGASSLISTRSGGNWSNVTLNRLLLNLLISDISGGTARIIAPSY